MFSLGIKTLAAAILLAGCDANLRVRTSSTEESERLQKPNMEREETSAAELFIVLDDELIAATPLTPRWEISGDIDVSKGFSFQARSDDRCDESTLRFEILSSEKSVNPASDGIYTLCLFGKTRSDAVVAASNNGIKVTIDRTPPHITIADRLTVNAPFTVHPIIEDLLATTLTWRKISGPGDVLFHASGHSDTRIEMTQAGNYELLLTVTDLAGHATEKLVQVTWDLSGPTVNAGADVVTNAPATISPYADMTAVRFLWEKVSGPGDVTFDDATRRDPTVQADAEGTYVLRFSAFDALDNRTDVLLSLIWDVTPPVVNIGGDIIVGAMTTLDATVIGGDVASHSWTKEAGPGTIIFGTPNTEDSTVAADTDGPYRLRLTVIDAAGNQAFDELLMTWDTTIPTVHVGADRFANDGLLIDATTTLGASFSWSQVSGPGTLNFGTPAAEDTIIGADTEGSYVVRLAVTNSSGFHTRADELTFVWDVTNPSVSVGVDQSSKDPINVNATTTDNLTTLNHQWTKVSGPGNVVFSQATAPTSLVTVDQDGTYVLRLTATDQAGNASFDELSYTRDATPPAFVALTAANGAIDGFVSAVEASSPAPLYELTATGHLTARYSILLDESTPQSCDSNITYDQTALPSLAAIGADGSWVLCVKLEDAFGNVAYGKSAVIVRDTVAPTVNAGIDHTSKVTVPLDATTTNAVSWSWTQVSGPGTIIFSAQTAEDTTVSADADGVYTLRLTASDAAGNTASDEVVLIWDTTGPTFTSLAPANEALDGYINGAELGAVSAAYILSAGAHAAATYTGFLSDSPPVTCDASQSYNPGDIPTLNVIPPSDGPYVVCVRLVDPLGNVTFGKSSVINRDTTAPTVSAGPDLSLAAPATIDAATSGASSWHWDKISGPGTITFGNMSAEDALVEMDTDGTYVLRLSASDAAGNAAADDVTIVWDRTPPAVNVGLDQLRSSLFTLNATTSDGATFVWSVQSGPGTVTFGSPNAEDTTVSASADGDYVLRLTVTDSFGNSAYDELGLTWDTQAPVLIAFLGAHEASDGYVNAAETGATNPAFALSASGSDGAAYTSFFNDDAPQTCDDTDNYALTSMPAVSDVPATDASYAVCVKLFDMAGNVVYGKSQVLVRDASIPTVNVGTDVMAGAPVNIDAMSSGATSFSWTRQSGPGSINFGSSSAEDTTVSASADGSHALRLTVSDAAGNTAYDELILTWDTVMPTVNVGSNRSANATVTLNAASSDGATFAWTQRSGPGTITFGSAASEDTTVSADVEGTYVLRLTVTDSAGNSVHDELDFTWDVTPPTFTSLVGANQASDGYVNASEANSAANLLTLSAANHDTARYTAVLPAASLICDASQDYASSSIPAISAMPATDASYAVCVELMDNAGNVIYRKSQTIVRDTQAPILTSFNGANQASDGYVNQSEVGSAAAIAAVVGSGYDVDDFTDILANGSLTCDGTKSYVNATPPLISAIGTTDGAYAVCVRLRDSAGNETYGKSQQIVRDTSAPAFTSLVGANGAADGYLNAAEVSSSAPMFVLSASDYATAAYSIVMDNTPPLTCDDAYGYGAGIPAINITPGLDEEYAVCVRLRDDAGNTTYARSQNIVRDTSAPSFAAMALANDAADGTINIADRNNDLPLVSAATGSGFTLAQYLLVTSATTCSLQTYGVSAIPSAGQLTGADGAYKVCVKLTDAANNTPAYGESAVITKNTTAPTVNLGSDRSVSSPLTLNPTVSGGSTYQWSVESGSPSDITFGSPTSQSTTVEADGPGTYTLRLTVANAAGNSAFDEMTFTWSYDAIMFVTSQYWTASSIGGYAGADSKCNARATAAGLPPTFKALLSGPTVNAKDRINLIFGVRRMDGALIASSTADLWDGTLANAPNRDENNASASLSYYTHSGTTSSGTFNSSYGTGKNACNSWSGGGGSDNVNAGYHTSYLSTWVESTIPMGCGSNWGRLYCVNDAPPIFYGIKGASSGRVDTKFTTPASITGWSSIEVRRLAGNTAPTCATGTLVSTHTGLSASTAYNYTDNTGSANAAFSYRACVKNAGGSVIKQYRHSGVMSAP